MFVSCIIGLYRELRSPNNLKYVVSKGYWALWDISGLRFEVKFGELGPSPIFGLSVSGL